MIVHAYLHIYLYYESIYIILYICSVDKAEKAETLKPKCLNKTYTNQEIKRMHFPRTQHSAFFSAFWPIKFTVVLEIPDVIFFFFL